MEDQGVKLTPQQLRHLQILQGIAQEMRDTPLILKGGSALVFGYQQTRFTEDLDFDSPKKLNLEQRIGKAVMEAEARLLSIHTPKDTDTVQRYKVLYETPEGWISRLKIETSFREDSKNSEVREIGGIRMYGVETLIDHKLACMENRVRQRDLLDVAFLINTYADHFSPEQAERLGRLMHDSAALEARYSQAFEDAGEPSGMWEVQKALVETMDGIEKLEKRGLFQNREREGKK